MYYAQIARTALDRQMERKGELIEGQRDIL